MSTAITTSPSAMVNRIALREGASTNSLLAQVARTRGEMLARQAEEERADQPAKPF